MPPRRTFRFPRISFLIRADELVRSFSASGRALFYILAGLIIASSISLVYLLNNTLQVQVPLRGSSYTEGIVGSPRFINPVLALSDADRDTTALIYSGLLKAAPDGSYVPDLAEDYTISPDGKTYTVRIRPNAHFQDGSLLTADDVIFTVNKALDPAIKSPLRANWQGIDVEALDTHTVQFTLAKPYAPFIENLSIGILPKHLWQNVSAEEFPFSSLNTQPVGSGPYKISRVSRTSSGIPSSYDLTAWNGYTLGEPYITHLTLRFYQNESMLVAALKSGDAEAGSGISPASLTQLSSKHVQSVPLDRVFGVFFNQNQNAVLRDSTVRKALGDAIDRTDLVKTVLGGYGVPTRGPIPPALGGPSFIASSAPTTASSTAADQALATARQELAAAGWKPNADGILQKTTGSGKKAQTQTLSFTLATGNVPELTAAANYVKNVWTKLGVQVTVAVYDQGDLSENVIRPRKYDALLFGEIIGRGLDLFAFWDSQERNDPGLNIALYANSTVDSLLEQLRAANDEDAREALYKKISQQINADAPAVFLYSPDFVYVVPKDMHGMTLGAIENPSDRFDTIQSWYRQTDHVWGIFAR